MTEAVYVWGSVRVLLNAGRELTWRVGMVRNETFSFAKKLQFNEVHVCRHPARNFTGEGH